MSAEAVKTVKPILDELGPKLNAYLRSIGSVPQPHSDDTENPSGEAKDKGEGLTTND
jgi:hypothetical protein